MCYKIEVQKKNEEKLKKKLDEVGIPTYMRGFFTTTIKSKAGAINYLGVIKDLLHYFMEGKIINRNSISDIKPEDFSEIMAENITEYLEIKENNGMSPTTLETRKNIIRSFWNYISRVKGSNIAKDFFDDVTYSGISSSDNNLVKKLPSNEQIKQLEEKISNKTDDFLRIRNLSIVRLLKGSGLRESELVGLELKDLFLNEDIPYVKTVRKGKYREMEARNVFLTNDAKEAIVEWLEVRNEFEGVENLNALFITKKLKRMRESDVMKMFKSASNSELSPHMMRHWYATVMAKKLGVVFTQQNLGHTSMNTTINNYANGSYEAKDILASM